MNLVILTFFEGIEMEILDGGSYSLKTFQLIWKDVHFGITKLLVQLIEFYRKNLPSSFPNGTPVTHLLHQVAIIINWTRYWKLYTENRLDITRLGHLSINGSP